MLISCLIKSCLIAHLIISFCYLISSRVVTHLTLFYFILSYFILFHFTFNRQHCTHATIPSSLSNPVTEQPLPSIHFTTLIPEIAASTRLNLMSVNSAVFRRMGASSILDIVATRNPTSKNECDTRQSFFAHEDPQ